jgi:hypothetical protein
MYLYYYVFVHKYLLNQQLMNLLPYLHKVLIFLVSQFEYLMEYIVKMISLNREPSNRNSIIVFWKSYNYKIKKK